MPMQLVIYISSLFILYLKHQSMLVSRFSVSFPIAQKKRNSFRCSPETIAFFVPFQALAFAARKSAHMASSSSGFSRISQTVPASVFAP